MEQRVFYGNITPTNLAEALLAEFNRGNLRAQVVGESARMIVQVATRPGAQSGGQTALTVTMQKVPEGVMVQIGQQAWLGVAASLGQTAFAALRNPFSLLGRLDDLAQDIESLNLQERILQVIARTTQAAGAKHELTDRLSRLACPYCSTANPVGEANCLACGAPLGEDHPVACPHCGYVVSPRDTICSNCQKAL